MIDSKLVARENSGEGCHIEICKEAVRIKTAAMIRATQERLKRPAINVVIGGHEDFEEEEEETKKTTKQRKRSGMQKVLVKQKNRERPDTIDDSTDGDKLTMQLTKCSNFTQLQPQDNASGLPPKRRSKNVPVEMSFTDIEEHFNTNQSSLQSHLAHNNEAEEQLNCSIPYTFSMQPSNVTCESNSMQPSNVICESNSMRQIVLRNTDMGKEPIISNPLVKVQMDAAVQHFDDPIGHQLITHSLVKEQDANKNHENRHPISHHLWNNTSHNNVTGELNIQQSAQPMSVVEPPFSSNTDTLFSHCRNEHNVQQLTQPPMFAHSVTNQVFNQPQISPGMVFNQPQIPVVQPPMDQVVQQQFLGNFMSMRSQPLGQELCNQTITQPLFSQSMATQFVDQMDHSFDHAMVQNLYPPITQASAEDILNPEFESFKYPNNPS
eukprot:GHVL01012981.1.p1 GENE.GHVL01012981.1~~GHVL01012981.1.p1  ORF type:complete len:436 (-),score=60.52 GHVL01012981.1:2097-3404(-)